MPDSDKIAVLVDGRELTLSNLTKVLYPEDGFSKAEVLDYYQRISPLLLPHIAGRPVTLRRYPHGVADLSFFAKHAPDKRPGWLRTEEVMSRSSRARSPGAPVRYLVIDDLPALIWAVNLAAIELHVPMWHFPYPADRAAADRAAADSVPADRAADRAIADRAAADRAAVSERQSNPDLLVFDLDPGAPATIVECCRVAEALRPVLAAASLDALPKTSGGKGLQLYARVSGMTAEQASGLAKSIAERLERELPRLVVSRMAKSLRAGKVFIDWSQNNGSKTTVAPYSLRARERPTVSTPVTWDEVAACRKVADLTFTAPQVLDRADDLGDLFAPLLGAAS